MRICPAKPDGLHEWRKHAVAEWCWCCGVVKEVDRLNGLLAEVRAAVAGAYTEPRRAMLKVRSLTDPWDQCLDVDPPTGQPDHEHGDACENPDCS